MKKYVIPMEPNHLYHVFNRGINGGALFFNHLNYHYFLKLIEEKIGKIADVYSYCLMQNHFHLLVRIKSEDEIRHSFANKALTVEKIISQQFSNAFNSYTQAINKSFDRTGKLFELPFRRKIIKTEEQLRNAILYINANPKKHGIETSPFEYEYSSAKKILMNDPFLMSIMSESFDTLENFRSMLLAYQPK